MKKIILLLLIFIPLNLLASERKTTFSFELFNEAIKSNKIIVINSWNKSCGTCAKQIEVLEQAKKDFQDVIFLSYEQTTNKKIAEFLKIDFWATIVVYNGDKEVSKVLGITDKDKIYSLIKKQG